MANNLAIHFTERGYDVTLVTPIRSKEPDELPYRIVRAPSFSVFLELARQTDLIFSNGASLYAAPYAILTGKPVIMRHTNYVVSSVDGAGWFDGKLAPLTPGASIVHHFRHNKLGSAVRGAAKVISLRVFAKKFVARNVAISDWMMKRHPLPNQVRIHNPFPIVKFVEAINHGGNYEYDFFYLGRLITEKGVDVLLEAFKLVQQSSGDAYTLCIIGDGPDRGRLEGIAQCTGKSAFVTFAGMQTGQALIEKVRSCKIAVLPSTWEEPFGGASTELLAAGKNMIVSSDGALSEIVADGGLTFKNGDVEQLAAAMLRLAGDEVLRSTQIKNAAVRLKDFDEIRLIDQYVALIEEVLRARSRS